MPYRVRERFRFDPDSDEPFKLSRSRLEMFMNCPRCFYLDRVLGVDRVGMPAFTLNSATDTLLKKEFDVHRAAGTPHPIMEQYGIDAVPFQRPDIDTWRENFKGLQFQHEPTNLIITGAVDDIWAKPDGSLIAVDYKSTSTQKEISLDDQWKQAYKRQMEIYQWLLRQNGFTVSDTGYFLFVNANTDLPAFNGRLEFDMQIIPYEGCDDWVDEIIRAAWDCLTGDPLPDPSDECEWCAYRDAAAQQAA